MAISAVDIALWDLKAQARSASPLAALLGTRARGGAGLRQRRLLLVRGSSELAEQLAGWVADGIPRVKMKVGREPERDLGRVEAAREAIGADAELYVDANGAYTAKQALAFAAEFATSSA